MIASPVPEALREDQSFPPLLLGPKQSPSCLLPREEGMQSAPESVQEVPKPWLKGSKGTALLSSGSAHLQPSPRGGQEGLSCQTPSLDYSSVTPPWLLSHILAPFYGTVYGLKTERFWKPPCRIQSQARDEERSKHNCLFRTQDTHTPCQHKATRQGMQRKNEDAAHVCEELCLKRCGE